MADDSSKQQLGAGETIWIAIDRASPLSSVQPAIEMVPERQRWMAAPLFSAHRYTAKPKVIEVGWLKALWLLWRSEGEPRDHIADRLNDIEQLILGGHHDAADREIDRLRSDYPGEAMKERVLGLSSLNLYDRGNIGKAQYIHEFALLCGSAHPAMVEIFGNQVREPGGT